MRNRLFLSLTLALFLLASCAPQGAPLVPTPIPTSIAVQKPTYTVQRGEVIKVLEMHGRVSAVKQSDLFFSVEGVVEEILVSRGDMVKAGQVLAYLSERASYEADLADARLELIKTQKSLDSLVEEADLHSAEAYVAMLEAQSDLEEVRRMRAGLDSPRADELTIAKAETILALAEKNLKKAQRQWAEVEHLRITNPERFLALTNLSSALQERDRALANFNWYTGHSTEYQIMMMDGEVALAEAKYQEAVRIYERSKDGPDPFDISLAEATVARAQVNLDKAQAKLDSLMITAPFDGQIISLALYPGMQVKAYETILTLVDPEGLEITLLPTAAELAEINVGQVTIVRLTNRPGQELRGTVRYLPLPSSGRVSLQETDKSVRISLEDDNSMLTMGEAATVIIQLEKRENVLWISPAALRTFQGRDFVIVQDGDLQRRVDVRQGLKSHDRVEIFEGLIEGQVVLGP
jgi:HlyD family secretion protein